MQIFVLEIFGDTKRTSGCRFGKFEFEFLSISLPYFVHKLTSSLCTNVK